VFDQSNVPATAGIVLDTNNIGWSSSVPPKIDGTQAAFMTSSSRPNSNVAVAVPATFLSKRNGKLANGATSINMRGYGTAEMAKGRCYGFVCLESIHDAGQRLVKHWVSTRGRYYLC
jgi:hypothetical protein